MKIATIRQNPELCFFTSLQAGVNFDSERLGGVLIRLLARRASWDAPRTKSGCLWTPKLWGKREIIFNDSLSILTYPKRNSFNSHYYYTFDILINLMVYLAE